MPQKDAKFWSRHRRFVEEQQAKDENPGGHQIDNVIAQFQAEASVSGHQGEAMSSNSDSGGGSLAENERDFSSSSSETDSDSE